MSITTSYVEPEDFYGPMVPVRNATPYKLLGGFQVLDVATTWTILANHSARAEGNPIVAGMIHHSGLMLSMILLLILKLAIVYSLYRKQTGIKIMSAIYGLVLVNNFLFLGLWLLA